MFTLQNFKNQNMNRIIKTGILFFAMLFIVISVHAQEANKDVTITSSGSGKTMEDAKQAALRSATEQAFGAFISSKTEMFNDQVVADQMASVSSGNIKSYEILNQDQLPDGRWGVTLKAIVSVDKLTSFVEAKGIAIEVKGGMFALNIKQQLLNEQGEIKAVAEMIGLLHEPMQTAFDYTIKSGTPQSLDAESKNWSIPLEVTATSNKNMDFCANYFIKTIAALSLTENEVETYRSLNKIVFPVKIRYAGNEHNYNLRKQTSIKIINSLTSNWEFYIRLFTVQSGLDESTGNGSGKIRPLGSFSSTGYYDANTSLLTSASVFFRTSGELEGKFSWNDTRTLSQIEQITSYSVRPRGVISNFKNGGYVVYDNDGHGLVVALYDIGIFNWENAIKVCSDFSTNGYGDWYLPSKEELQIIYENVHLKGIGAFLDYYWSCTPSFYCSYSLYFPAREKRHLEDCKEKERVLYVRAVRKF